MAQRKYVLARQEQGRQISISRCKRVRARPDTGYFQELIKALKDGLTRLKPSGRTPMEIGWTASKEK